MSRKQLASKGFASQVPQECRTKARNEGVTQEQPSTSQAPSTPILGASKPITTRRRIDFGFLTRESFSIEEKIKNMSWRFFVHSIYLHIQT